MNSKTIETQISLGLLKDLVATQLYQLRYAFEAREDIVNLEFKNGITSLTEDLVPITFTVQRRKVVRSKSSHGT